MKTWERFSFLDLLMFDKRQACHFIWRCLDLIFSRVLRVAVDLHVYIPNRPATHPSAGTKEHDSARSNDEWPVEGNATFSECLEEIMDY